MVAVGGNGQVQIASDTWLTPEHQTLEVERPVAHYSGFGEGATAVSALGAINRSGGRRWLKMSTLGT